MPLRPVEVEVPEDEPFKNCQLGLQRQGEVLEQFLSTLDEPYVLAIDSPWGSGKSTFIRMLRQQLKNNGFNTIHFNAWESDFCEEPFVGMVSEVTSALSKLPGNQLSPKTEKIKAAGKQVLKRLIPVGAKIATMGALDLDKELESVERAMAGASEKIAEDMMDSYGESKSDIKCFRETLEQFVEGLGKPLIFFVDELDRCRPSFAVELLERAKHLFSVNGVVFLLAVDKTQLGHSIQGLYGPSFDAAGYLRRFIDMDYHLHPKAHNRFYDSAIESSGVKGELSRLGDYSTARRTGMHSLLESVFSGLNLSLREQIQLLSRAAVVLKTIPSGEAVFDYELSLMLVLRDRRPELFRRYSSGGESVEDVIEFFCSIPGDVSDDLGEMTKAVLIVGCKSLSESQGELDLESRSDELKGHVRKMLSHGRWNMKTTIDRLKMAESFYS